MNTTTKLREAEVTKYEWEFVTDGHSSHALDRWLKATVGVGSAPEDECTSSI
jgi:hypothetical protein